MELTAPLVSIPAAPAPAGAEAVWTEGEDGVRLRAAWFPAPGTSRGSAVLSPGRTEPIEKYFEVVGELHQRGLDVLAHDWRGQGLSQRALPDRLKGHGEDPEVFARDYRRLIADFEARLKPPRIALAHSMGGGLVLLALARGEPRLTAAVFTAPMIAFSTAPAPKFITPSVLAVMRLAGRLAEYAAPAVDPLKSPFEGNPLTHDRARFARTIEQLKACPELALGTPTWGWIEMAAKLESDLAAPGVLEAVQQPLLIVSAGQERLVLNVAIRDAAARLAHAELLEIPGALHEILMETDDLRARFWAAFDGFLSKLSAPPS